MSGRPILKFDESRCDGWMKLSEMEDSPYQRNEHPEDQIVDLAYAMKVEGITHPIFIVKGTKRICFGHGRKYAALLNEWEEFPIIFIEFESEDQEYRMVQSDNAFGQRSLLDMRRINFDVPKIGPFEPRLLGFKDFSPEPMDKYGDKDADEIPVSRRTDITLGELYSLGNHRLLCGDSTDMESVSRLMNGELENCFLVLSDPPYGIKAVKNNKVGSDFGVAKKGIYKEVRNDESTKTAKDYYELMWKLGFHYWILWGGNYFTEFLIPSNSWVIWNKRGDTSIKNTFSDGEMAWSNIGFPVRIYHQLWNGMIREGEKDKRVHPTQKPIALFEFCINLFNNATHVYDGFLGSGSTLIACEKTNRRCFGMEIDPQYCQVIIDRWEKFTGLKAEKIN